MRGFLSLDKPLGNTEDFTLLDIIPSPPIEPDDIEYKRNGKLSIKQITLDSETADILKSRFGNIPLGRAIRALIGLPILTKQECWQDWEDKVICEYYPDYGYEGVKVQEVIRSRNAIINRAQKLGAKRNRGLPHVDDYLYLKEIARICGCDYTEVFKWYKQGLLKAQLMNIKKPHLVVKKEDFIQFLQTASFIYPHEKIASEYKKFIPSQILEWMTVREVGEKLAYSPTGISNHISKGHIPCKKGFHNSRYIKLFDLESYLRNPPKLLLRLENWKVKSSGRMRHFIQPDENGVWYRVCRRGSDRPAYDPEWGRLFGYKLKFERGLPNCKVCLTILKNKQREGGIALCNKSGGDKNPRLIIEDKKQPI